MTNSEFNQRVNSFFAKYDDKKIDFDGLYGAQCVDLIKFYFQEVIGIDPKARGNAVNYWDNCPELDQIPNTPTGVPEKGDIIIWNAKIGGGSGHIAIATGKGDTNNFDSFDQNWPTGSACHYQGHNYLNVIGWLQPKNINDPEPVQPPIQVPQAPATTPTPIEPVVDPRDSQIAFLIDRVAKLTQQTNDQGSVINGLNETLGQKESQITDLTNRLGVCQSSLTDTQKDQDEKLSELSTKLSTEQQAKNDLMAKIAEDSRATMIGKNVLNFIQYLPNLISNISKNLKK